MKYTQDEQENFRKLILDNLNKLLSSSDLNLDNKISLIASIKTYVFEDAWTNKELATEIYEHQYRINSSFKQALYELMYKSSEDNLLKFAFGFTMETEAFKKYGRENVNILKNIINEG